MKNTAIKYAAAVLAAMSILATAAHARADDERAEAQAAAKTLRLITLEQATEKALAAKPGVVTDAELDDRDFGKGWDYEFEIVDADGTEWDVRIDAKSGEVRSVRRDWF